MDKSHQGHPCGGYSREGLCGGTCRTTEQRAITPPNKFGRRYGREDYYKASRWQRQVGDHQETPRREINGNRTASDATCRSTILPPTTGEDSGNTRNCQSTRQSNYGSTLSDHQWKWDDGKNYPPNHWNRKCNSGIWSGFRIAPLPTA